METIFAFQLPFYLKYPFEKSQLLTKGSCRKKFTDFWCWGARPARRESAGISGIFRAFATQPSGMHRHL